MIPGVELCEIPESHFCCGSAGTYNIDQPEIAHSLASKKSTTSCQSIRTSSQPVTSDV